MPTEDPARRLQDILENSTRIREYTCAMTREAFMADRRTVDAVERCLERMAEAARKLGTRYDDAYPELELPRLRGFGNVLRHDYEAVSPQRLWAFLRRLDGLETFAHTELERIGRGG